MYDLIATYQLARQARTILFSTEQCRLVTRRGQDGSESTEAGGGPGYRFDVRGHFRRLPDGRLTWVRAHQRGLANELYVPSVRKVE